MSSMVVRPLTSNSEIALQIRLADQAFSPEPSEEGAQRWQTIVTTSPEYRPDGMRGAFQDGEQLGGYILYERKMHIGASEVLTGCIAAVVAHPAQRKKGVATALMHDAIAYAKNHNYALLLLDGIPNFYYRYGYVDVFDLTVQDVDRAAILAQPASAHSVRVATIEDAQALLYLYNRHYNPYTGSFVRSLERQIHLLQYRDAKNPPLFSMDAAGQPHGYLSLRPRDRANVGEIAADSWDAGLALLQYHAHLLSGETAATTLRYRMPSTFPLLQWMVDHLELPDTSHWDDPAEMWVVREQVYRHRFASWMARLVSLPMLMQALLPELQVRWQRSLASWSGTITVSAGKESSLLRFDGQHIALATSPSPSKASLHLTPQELVQIVFGYRAVSWALERRGQALEQEAINVLNILFPTSHTWIPSSDWF